MNFLINRFHGGSRVYNHSICNFYKNHWQLCIRIHIITAAYNGYVAIGGSCFILGGVSVFSLIRFPRLHRYLSPLVIRFFCVAVLCIPGRCISSPCIPGLCIPVFYIYLFRCGLCMCFNTSRFTAILSNIRTCIRILRQTCPWYHPAHNHNRISKIIIILTVIAISIAGRCRYGSPGIIRAATIC